jgi:SAM-dependent methyltransferase
MFNPKSSNNPSDMRTARQILTAPIARAAAIYTLSVPLAITVAPRGLPWEFLAAMFAVMLVPVSRLGPWWLVINAVFLPALTTGLKAEVSPLWAFGALAALVLLYGRIWRSPVPIFFSSRRAQAALAKLLPSDRSISFLDAGCGDGRVLARLALRRPESHFEGIEHAMGLWLAARLRCRTLRTQCRVLRGNLWSRTLTQYDVVYAFLSPVVMERLWEKAQREMRPGTLLVSAFAVPNISADEHIEVPDVFRTRLHVWRIGADRKGP